MIVLKTEMKELPKNCSMCSRRLQCHLWDTRNYMDNDSTVHPNCLLMELPNREGVRYMLENVTYQSVREQCVLNDMIADCLDKLGFKKEDK